MLVTYVTTYQVQETVWFRVNFTKFNIHVRNSVRVHCDLFGLV